MNMNFKNTMYCSSCKDEKPLEAFYKSSLEKNDHRCKSCIRDGRRENTKNVRYLLNIFYMRQVHNRRGEPVPYSFEEFYKWALNNDIFMRAFRFWSESDFKDDVKPSIIRVNSKKGFTFDNLRVVEKHRITQFKIDPRARPVKQHSLDGVYLATYPNAKVASEMLSIKSYAGINGCCRGYRKSSHGFKWTYV